MAGVTPNLSTQTGINQGHAGQGQIRVAGQGQGHTPIGGSSYGAGGSGGGIPRLGPTRKSGAGAFVEDRWLGRNEAVSPDRLSPVESPDLINMDTWQRRGSLSTRMCRGKCAEAGSRGTGVCVLPTSFLTSSGVRSVVAVSYSVSAQTLELTGLTLPAKPERSLDFVPDVTLSSPSDGNIRVALSALDTVGGIEAVLCSWGTVGYPTSPWSVDSQRNTEGREETAWFGIDAYQTDTDVTGELSATGRVFVTVWLIGRLGLSQPYHGSVEVTIS